MRHATALLFAAAILTVVPAVASWGQPASHWEDRGLSPIPVTLESVGMAVHFPLDSKVTKQPQSNQRLIVEPADLTWIMTVEVEQTVSDEPTISDLINNAIANAQRESHVAHTPSRSTLEINGQPAEQVKIALKRPSGIDEIRVCTVFKPLPRTYVIHTLWCDAQIAPKAEEVNRRVVESIRFDDPEALARQREGALKATEQALEALTESDYRRVLNADRWYRVYTTRPDGSPDAERGYYRIQESVAPRQAIEESSAARGGRIDDEDLGVLVVLTARYLQPDGSVYDVESRSWMSFDRSKELFSIRGAYNARLEDGGFASPLVSAVTGTRDGRRLEVHFDEPGQHRRTVELTAPGEAYLTQAERYLLYRLIEPKAGATFAMHIFEPTLQKIVMRQETFATSPEAGQLVSESRPSLDAQPNGVTVGEDGEVLRVVTATGETTVPIDPAEVQRLWKSKGLPTGALKARRGR